MASKRRHIGGGFCQEDFKSKRARKKPPKALLIVTEGRNTEPAYFRALKDEWNAHPKLLSIEPGGEGIPANLVSKAHDELKELKKKAKRGNLAYNELGHFDEVWIVFDVEHAQRQGRLDDGIEAANRHGFKIAPSNPCFEFWLALHFASNAPPMNSCDEAIRHLESVSPSGSGSYSKASGPTADFTKKVISEVPRAVANAVVVARNQESEPFPANPSTRVHELVYSIYESLPAPMKERFPVG